MKKTFNPSSNPEYTKAMFKHHCDSLKKGVGIGQYNRDTKECYIVDTYEELEKLFPKLNTEVKNQIKKEVGL